jgi:CubicO group peptidase (beta-lactamase class C family)
LKLHLAEFFTDLLSRPSIYLPGTTPIFSNTAFQLLAYALEVMQGKPFSELFHNLTTQLSMLSSSLSTPKDTTGAIIPTDVETSGWSTDYGDESP